MIRPSADLRNRYVEISEYCHTHEQPVFITRNGSGDLAVLSIELQGHLTGLPGDEGQIRKHTQFDRFRQVGSHGGAESLSPLPALGGITDDHEIRLDHCVGPFVVGVRKGEPINRGDKRLTRFVLTLNRQSSENPAKQPLVFQPRGGTHRKSDPVDQFLPFISFPLPPLGKGIPAAGLYRCTLLMIGL